MCYLKDMKCQNCGKEIRKEHEPYRDEDGKTIIDSNSQYIEVRWGEADPNGELYTEQSELYHQECIMLIKSENVITVREELLHQMADNLPARPLEFETAEFKNFITDLLATRESVIIFT